MTVYVEKGWAGNDRDHGAAGRAQRRRSGDSRRAGGRVRGLRPRPGRAGRRVFRVARRVLRRVGPEVRCLAPGQGRERRVGPRFSRGRRTAAARADGAVAPRARQAGDRRRRRPGGGGRDGARALVRHARDGRGRLLRRVLPPLGRTARRRRHRAVAAHRRHGTRDGSHPHRAQGAGGRGAAHRALRARRAAGTARAEAEKLAHEIARFPQGAVRADRRSAYETHGLPVRAALELEWRNGMPTMAEAVQGAGVFAAGKGRHGDFGAI